MNSVDWHQRSAQSIDESPKRSILDLSGYSIKLKQNFESQRQGESMFEFLKRRKRYAIQQQISKSRNKSRCEPPTDRTMLNQTIDLSTMKESKQMNKTQLMGSRTVDKDKMSTMSNKKVTFREQQSYEPTTNRTFFEIVSPFKKRAGLESYASADITRHDVRVPSAKKLKGKEQTMQKKGVMTKLEQLMAQVNGYVKDVENYKVKSHGILVEALGLLGEVEIQYGDKFLKKKVQEIRTSNKNVLRLYENLQISDPRQELATLTRELTDNINTIESQLRNTYEYEIQQKLKAKQEDFKGIIKTFEDKIRWSSKQIESLQNKLDKQANIENQQNNQQIKKINQSSKKHQTRVQQMQRKISQLTELNQNLQKDLKKSQQLCKDLDRQNRTLQSDKQSLLKSFEIQKQQIATRKQTYLLEEMASLKKQFQQDLNRVDNLYKMKQAQLLDQINNLQIGIQQIDTKLKCSLRSQATCTQQLALARTQLQKYRMQNDQLIRKLHLTTEQAHIYWSTLKDIKVLSTRLGLYGKFTRLFDEIKFSDSTFR